MSEQTQYMSQEKIDELKTELSDLKNNKAPQLRKRIDEARQMGDLSENAEYHAAREELAWVQSRIGEIQIILDNAQIIQTGQDESGKVTIGATVKVETHGKEKEFTIVGAQEANPLEGKISNESPLGSALLGKKKGEKVEVEIPAGTQVYKILKIS